MTVPGMPRQLAIITDDPGWHGHQLSEAFARHGITGICVSLSDCMIAVNGAGNDLIIPGFEQPPPGVFVRGFSGGTLEQLIFRLDILHALHDMGVVVYNSSRAIERTVDKPLTSLLLKRAGLPTPLTWICESMEQANDIVLSESAKGHKTVLKPLFGSQGVGMHLLDDGSGLIHDGKFAGVYYLQRFIEREDKPYTDIRILVIDGTAVAAMQRHSSNWLTNRAQGAECRLFKLDDEIVLLAETACRILKIDYAGVDLIRDKEKQYYIIEVNSIPAWYGLQQVVDFNIAALLVDSFLKHISEKRGQKR